MFPSSLFQGSSYDHLTIRVSIIRIFFFEGNGGESANACPSINKSIKKHHFLSSPVFKNILPTGEDSGRWNQAKCKISPPPIPVFLSFQHDICRGGGRVKESSVERTTKMAVSLREENFRWTRAGTIRAIIFSKTDDGLDALGMRVSSEKRKKVDAKDTRRWPLPFFTTFRAKPKLTLDEAADLSVDTQRSLERRKRTNLCAFVCMRERQARPRGLIRCELIQAVSLPLRIVHTRARG